MTPVKQSHPKGCFQACVASILDLPIEQVPDFCAPGFNGKDWWQGLLEWSVNRGYFPIEIKLAENAPCFSPIPDGVFCILSGKSPRGDYLHSVIGKSSQNAFDIVFDPHEHDEGLRGRVLEILFFVRQGVAQ